MKKFLFALLHSTGAIRLVSWWHRKHVPIICYHSVTAAAVNPDPHKQHIPLELFRQHLDYLQANYNVASLADYLSARRNNHNLPNYSVVLTFDDGFEDFYSVAAPHLSERNLPATVFVITERASGRSIPNGESFLNWDQIRELAAAGVDIGSHSSSHACLADLSPAEATTELSDSRAVLESNIGKSNIPFSFPFGKTSEIISRTAESLGYSCAIANDSGPNTRETSVYALSRTVIASDDDLATFSARVSGLTSWMTRWRRFFRTSDKVSWEPFTRRYDETAPEFYVD